MILDFIYQNGLTYQNEGNGAGVGRRDKGGQDDEAGGQNRDHVG